MPHRPRVFAVDRPLNFHFMIMIMDAVFVVAYVQSRFLVSFGHSSKDTRTDGGRVSEGGTHTRVIFITPLDPFPFWVAAKQKGGQG